MSAASVLALALHHLCGGKMKKALLNTAALAVVLNAAAANADTLTTHEAPHIQPAAPLWTGFYAGLNAGFGWGTNSDANSSMWNAGSWAITEGYSGDIRAEAPFAGGALGMNRQTMTQSGFSGGAQFGYGYQIGSNFLIGFETDIQGSNARGNASSVGVFGGSSSQSGYTVSTSGQGENRVSAGLDYLGTARARIGYLFAPNMLAYGTAGLAYGGAWANVVSHGVSNTAIASYYDYSPETPGVSQTFAGGGAGSTLLVGYSAGAGLEWMFTPNWSLKAESIYYNLGNMSLSTVAMAAPVQGPISYLQTNAGPGTIAGNTSINYQGIIARVGLNYHFNSGF